MKDLDEQRWETGVEIAKKRLCIIAKDQLDANLMAEKERALNEQCKTHQGFYIYKIDYLNQTIEELFGQDQIQSASDNIKFLI